MHSVAAIASLCRPLQYTSSVVLTPLSIYSDRLPLSPHPVFCVFFGGGMRTDKAFRVNVGELQAKQKPLQLWRPCTSGDESYEARIGFSNEILRLGSDGGAR